MDVDRSTLWTFSMCQTNAWLHFILWRANLNPHVPCSKRQPKHFFESLMQAGAHSLVVVDPNEHVGHEVPAFNAGMRRKCEHGRHQVGDGLQVEWDKQLLHQTKRSQLSTFIAGKKKTGRKERKANTYGVFFLLFKQNNLQIESTGCRKKAQNCCQNLQK